MASTERMTYTQVIPPDATYRVEKDEQFACWTDRNGNRVKARVLATGRCSRTVAGRWKGVYRDNAGRKCKTTPYGDRSSALAEALRLERHAREVREGRAPADSPTGNVPMADLVPAYVEYMEREGFARTHRDQCEAVLRKVIDAHRLDTAGRVAAEKLAAGLETDRKAGRQPGDGNRPFSLRTRNSWTATLKAFGAWLVATKRAVYNPFTPLPLANSEKARVRVRRHAEPGDLAKLVRAARGGGDREGLSGEDRAALYLIALYTGLRAGALFRLTPESFTWSGPLPVSVYSPARGQKAGEDHGIPLQVDAARELADWLRAKPAGDLLFPLRGKRPRTARMIRHDLAAAGLRYADGVGRVLDFHALRVCFGVMLAKAGVPLVIAQQLMQHSTPVLTANIYSRVGGELAGEVAKLPSLPVSLGTPLGTKHPRSLPEVLQKIDARTPPETKQPLKSKRK
jgi:integrase/recombinase XerC